MIRQFHSNLMPSTHPPAAVRPRAQTLRQRNVIHRVRLRVHDPDLLRPRRRLATLDSGGAVLGDSLHHDALRMLLLKRKKHRQLVCSPATTQTPPKPNFYFGTSAAASSSAVGGLKLSRWPRLPTDCGPGHVLNRLYAVLAASCVTSISPA
uniref:(northern house mosquito) hypothetical protein n=1 Tax=Culex pipiens TaxID=7175 RepID=A0A8D8I2Q4_CULPI